MRWYANGNNLRERARNTQIKRKRAYHKRKMCMMFVNGKCKNEQLAKVFKLKKSQTKCNKCNKYYRKNIIGNWQMRAF